MKKDLFKIGTNDFVNESVLSCEIRASGEAVFGKTRAKPAPTKNGVARRRAQYNGCAVLNYST
jgi:hypothetical protein